jgi:preprotein translocase subunit SecE
MIETMEEAKMERGTKKTSGFLGNVRDEMP